MKISLGAEDLAKGQLVEPGWYPCEIKGYIEKPATTDRSTNAIGQLIILNGEFKGSGGRFLFNEKAMGFAKGFFKALGFVEKINAKGEKELNAILDASVNGKKLDVYFVRGSSNKGNDFNEAKDYAPIGTNTAWTKS